MTEKEFFDKWGEETILRFKQEIQPTLGFIRQNSACDAEFIEDAWKVAPMQYTRASMGWKWHPFTVPEQRRQAIQDPDNTCVRITPIWRPKAYSFQDDVFEYNTGEQNLIMCRVMWESCAHIKHPSDKGIEIIFLPMVSSLSPRSGYRFMGCYTQDDDILVTMDAEMSHFDISACLGVHWDDTLPETLDFIAFEERIL